MSVGVSLFTIAEGAAYAPFVPRWWAAVQEMDPQPAEIILVIGSEDHAGVRDQIPRDAQIRFVELDEPFSNRYFTVGCESVTQEWAGFCGIDDQMLPRAYADIPEANEAGADILVGSILLSTGQVWQGSWDPQALLRHNTLPAHSPFRKSLWEKVGGFPDIRWSDWGFWLKCAAHNASTFQSRDLLAIFDVGQDHETMSGVSLDPQIRAAADRELLDFARSL